jgi:hypothetical protein
MVPLNKADICQICKDMKTEFISFKCHCLEMLIWVMRKSGAHIPNFANLSFPYMQDFIK